MTATIIRERNGIPFELRFGQGTYRLVYYAKTTRARGKSEFERFKDKVEAKPDGHWHWVGATTDQGYGCMCVGPGRFQSAHRVSYRHHVGPIPKGKKVSITCGLRTCVNPEHLKLK